MRGRIMMGIDGGGGKWVREGAGEMEEEQEDDVPRG